MSSPRRTTLPLLLAAVLALVAPRSAASQAAATADAQVPATAYRACVVSRQVVTVGAPVLLILAPKNGPWPPGVVFTPIAAGLQGSFIPASAKAVSGALLEFVFTPAAPGEGTLIAINDMDMLEAPLVSGVLPPGFKFTVPPVCSTSLQVLPESVIL